MGLFDNIDKLITEHGSSGILKERLLLAQDKYEFLERKLAAIEGEKLKLQEHAKNQVQEIQRLSSEIQRLRDELAKHQTAKDTLDEEKQRILIALAKHSDPVSAERVASMLGLHVLKVEHALTELERQKFIVDLIYMGRPPEFTIGDKGKKFLVDNNLLGEVGTPIPSSRGGRMFPRVV